MNLIAPIGHNNFIDPLDAELADALKAFQAQWRAREGEVDRATVTTKEEAERATALAGILADLAETADKKRIEIKEPYLRASRKVDGVFGVFIQNVKEAKARVVAMISAYGAEQKRFADAEVARLAKDAREKEEAARAAAAGGSAIAAARLESQAAAAARAAAQFNAPLGGPIRSSYGQTASARTTWRHEIVDRKKLPLPITQHPKVTVAIDDVIAAMVRSGTREIPGVRIYAEQKTVIRR